MAFISVSILLIVKDIASTITITDSVKISSFNNKEKKARSGVTFKFLDTDTNPVKPIIYTMGIIIKKENNKLFFKTSLFFAA